MSDLSEDTNTVIVAEENHHIIGVAFPSLKKLMSRLKIVVLLSFMIDQVIKNPIYN